jgi:hypothetical protein
VLEGVEQSLEERRDVVDPVVGGGDLEVLLPDPSVARIGERRSGRN